MSWSSLLRPPPPTYVEIDMPRSIYACAPKLEAAAYGSPNDISEL